MQQQPVEEIDGGILEGGGQVIRNSLAFAVLRGLPVKISNIRAGRPNPGLQPQHLKGVEVVSAMCGAGAEALRVGSTTLSFVPFKLLGGEFSADTKTAGSVALLIQSVMPCAIFAPDPCVFKFKGGTNTNFAPHIDYLTMVALPILARMGVVCDIDLQQRGFYPKGCGVVEMRAQPMVSLLQPIILDTRGEVVRLSGRVFVSSVARHVADVMVATATHALRQVFPSAATVPLVLEVEEVPAAKATRTSAGFGLVLVAETTTGCFLGGSAVESGNQCLAPEVVAESAASELLADWRAGGCVDRHLQDQLIIFMALAQGRSRVRLGTMELHTETAIHLARQLAGGATFNITKEDATNTFVVECDGVGYTH